MSGCATAEKTFAALRRLSLSERLLLHRSNGLRDDYRTSTYIGTNHSSDSRSDALLRFSNAMSILAPIEVNAAEKLELLQRLDRYRKWNELGDKRYCLACGRIIEGHDIVIVGGTRGTGPLRLVCPTNGCHSITMDWVIPTEQVLQRLSALEDRQSGRPRSGSAHSREKFSARLRRFATHFRRAA
jgi:hypothetical protein